MRRCVTLLLALATLPVIAGPAWRWVDADGTIHYSDRPVPGAVEVYLPDATPSRARQEAPDAGAVPAPAPRAAAVTPVVEEPVPAYTRLAIASPAHDETLWNIGAMLTIVVTATPRLAPGHRVVILYDGEPSNVTEGPDMSFTLSEVYRGLHTVQAVIVDSSNARVIESQPVQFMVQQTSLLNPARN